MYTIHTDEECYDYEEVFHTILIEYCKLKSNWDSFLENLLKKKYRKILVIQVHI